MQSCLLLLKHNNSVSKTMLKIFLITSEHVEYQIILSLDGIGEHMFFFKKKFLSGPQCVRTRVVFSEDLGFRPQCPHFGQQISTTPVLGALKSGLLRHPGMHMENTPT